MTQKRSQSSSKLEENQWKNIANQFKGENIERYFIDFSPFAYAKSILDFMTQKRSQSSSKLEEYQWKNIANQFKGENIERCTCIHGINFLVLSLLVPNFLLYSSVSSTSK